jgi:hypothetical protein
MNNFSFHEITPRIIVFARKYYIFYRDNSLANLLSLFYFFVCTNNNACGLIMVETIKESSVSPCLALGLIL